MTLATAAQPAKAFDVAAVRRDFPILARTLSNGRPLVYLDNGASAQKPQSVIDKVSECYETYFANAYRGVYELGARVDEEMEAARAKVQRLLGAREPEEIIFTSGTTASVNLVAQGWGRKFLKPGDEILLTVMEHHANLVPWQMIAREKQAVLRHLPLTEDGRLDLSRLNEVLTPRTKLVAVTGMSNVLGTVNPVGELAAAACKAGAKIFVDAAQSVPHEPVDVRDLDVDFLAFSGHKLYGPTGIGVLYGRRAALEAMDPFLGGGHMIDEVFLDRFTSAEIPAKFEAGTIPIVQAIGLGAAVDYVQSVGFDAIAAQERLLLEAAFEKLSAIPGLRIVGPDVAHRGAIVSFAVDGVHPHDMASLLDERGVAVRAGHHCTMPLHEWLHLPATTRASFAFYNTLDEVDALADAIRYARRKFRLPD